ncbi:MAG: flagellar basal-body rod protein FlgB [Nocardioidaceae bacterium]|jgi:flagellar basal-body rod protein FlgB|nr:flagellar basal-body rod protein FlgB [Nocardioidaceae bacterium]
MLISASDPVGAALHTALDGLALRQQVTSNNIANVDTPNFTASQVGFEDSLRGALQGPSFSPSDAQASTTSTSDPAGADGNNVDLAHETMTAMQTTFSYQLLTRAVGDRFGMITTAIGGA